MRYLFVFLIATQVACTSTSDHSAEYRELIKGNWALTDGTVDGKPGKHLLEGITMQFDDKQMTSNLLELLNLGSTAQYLIEGNEVLNAVDKTVIMSIKELANDKLSVVVVSQGRTIEMIFEKAK